jgi:hypothetical protein
MASPGARALTLPRRLLPLGDGRLKPGAPRRCTGDRWVLDRPMTTGAQDTENSDDPLAPVDPISLSLSPEPPGRDAPGEARGAGGPVPGKIRGGGDGKRERALRGARGLPTISRWCKVV